MDRLEQEFELNLMFDYDKNCIHKKAELTDCIEDVIVRGVAIANLNYYDGDNYDGAVYDRGYNIEDLEIEIDSILLCIGETSFSEEEFYDHEKDRIYIDDFVFVKIDDKKIIREVESKLEDYFYDVGNWD